MPKTVFKQKRRDTSALKKGTLSSSVQTLLLVLEFHQIVRMALADFTASREFHPALKTFLFSCRIQHTAKCVRFQEIGRISEAIRISNGAYEFNEF